jgi:O-antigen ligase
VNNPNRAARDPLARLTEWGLMAVIILAPLPFGAVEAFGRVGLELLALALGLLWLWRARSRPVRLPGKLAIAGIIGLLLLALFQLMPLGGKAVRLLSPGTAEVYSRIVTPEEVREAEQRLIGIDPLTLEKPRTLSVDRGATASALRAGVALCLIFLAATAVAAARGLRGMAAALLVSASFQGLYGILVLASGYDRIWHIAKVHYLDAATGTFINKNNFACFLAASLACGAALIIRSFRGEGDRPGRRLLLRVLGGRNSRNLLLGLLLVIALAGLLLSLSRAGIALGLSALILTTLLSTRGRSMRVRAGIALAITLLASIPLLQLGHRQLADRYSRSVEHWTAEGGRLTVWGDTLAMGASYPLFGAGYGTFATAYPLHRSPEVRQFWKNAHNDFIQSFAEGGMLGTIFAALLLASMLITVVRAFAGKGGTIAVGFAAGLMVFILHSLIDFNLHIPANAAVAALLAGALQGLPWRSG